ncbi:MAG: hypothetical protein R3B70_08195 [Polyangiaceae bacterium]
MKAPKAEDDIYEDLDKPRHGTPTTKDPLAIAGGPAKIGPKAAHVQVLFNGNRLRDNSAGANLGGVLTALPEWKSFFDGTGIDPIKDTEHLLIAGPQLRRSREVVVWMQYRVPEKDMRAAIDTLVKRTRRGRWIEDAPVPAAVAAAHGHRRIFALVPNKKLLVILPLTARKDLERVKSVGAFNQTSKAGIVISLSPPQNAFAGFEDVVEIPKTFKWMRMVVTPLKSGDADVTLEIGDASAEDAHKNASLVEKQLSQVRTLAKLATLIGAEVLPPMKVETDNDILRVKATVSRKGLTHILNLARAHFGKQPEPRIDPKDDEDPYDIAPVSSASASAAPAAPPAMAHEEGAKQAPRRRIVLGKGAMSQHGSEKRGTPGAPGASAAPSSTPSGAPSAGASAAPKPPATPPTP